MTGKDADKSRSRPHQVQDRNPDQGTVLDRIKMPPMSGEEALRRFEEDRSGDNTTQQQSDLAQLHPIMKLIALGGTLLMVVTGLLGILYLFAA
ncbi:MAG: hypothetical protein RIG26_09320 [Thalassospira sp.]|uniref:hypothetical protein n=1 Tax=Thalassospira sp. TaxID=1912094 RepID=UPI0032EBB2F3